MWQDFLDLFAKGYDVPLWEQLLRVILATILGAVIGLERELKNKPAGFITFMLVSMGSCLFALLQINIVKTNISVVDPGAPVTVSLDTTRLIAQVVSGIGFLGAGTIIHTRGGAKGITTAALLWVSASIGLLVGMGGIANYFIALVTTLIIFPATLLLRRFGRMYVAGHRIYRMDIVFEEQHEQELYDKITTNGGLIKKTFFHTKYVENNVHYKEVFVYVGITKHNNYNELVDMISNENWVLSVEDA